MIITTNNLDAVFVTLFDIDAADFEIKSFTKDEVTTTKTAPNGKVVYRTDVKALVVDAKTGKQREDKTINLAVIEPSDVESGKKYKAAGQIWVTPYVNNQNRAALSVIAERLELVDAPVSFKKPAGE